ncbi:MAG: hypothetical protein ACK5QW_05365 [Cyanobacteriota bacterium]
MLLLKILSSSAKLAKKLIVILGPKVVLAELGVNALIGKIKTADMAMHTGLQGDEVFVLLVVAMQAKSACCVVQGGALLAEGKPPTWAFRRG